MSDKPISPLRQRLIDGMTARRFSEKLQKAYVRHVRTFTAFLGRSPDPATSEDLRRFQLHMVPMRERDRKILRQRLESSLCLLGFENPRREAGGDHVQHLRQ
jgi:hypothetical protein